MPSTVSGACVAPPTVQVSANYTGASADVVERTITLPIEEQVNGVEGMLYMSSTSANDGQMNLTVTFELERDPDIATVNVNNRVAIAEPRLPEEVRRFGITTRKQSPELTLVANLLSPDSSRDALVRLYGEEKGRNVRCAEAFEVCEYGQQPTPDMLRELFPFF